MDTNACVKIIEILEFEILSANPGFLILFCFPSSGTYVSGVCDSGVCVSSPLPLHCFCPSTLISARILPTLRLIYRCQSLSGNDNVKMATRRNTENEEKAAF